MKKYRIAFLCVHNSCRSQIAEALGKEYGKEIFDVYSAGTEIKQNINQKAVKLMKSIYNIDMEEDQKPKLIYDIPQVDYVITMGCNVVCPILDYEYKSEDWGLDDPTEKPDTEFIEIIEKIDYKVREFVKRFNG